MTFKEMVIVALGGYLKPCHSIVLGDFFESVRWVESGGKPNRGRDALGDGGKALGPFQIHEVYWKDAGVTGKYDDVRKEGYAKKVMFAYWLRYCPDALMNMDWETLARVHNGGPDGRNKDSTAKYWKKVREAMETQEWRDKA